MIDKEISIVTPSAGWYLEYALILKENIKNLGYKVHLIHDHQELKEGTIAFYLSYPYIAGPEYISKSFKSLVVHASHLPQGKGWSPWVWQILEGKNSIPICLFEMVEKVDAGPIVYLDHMDLHGDELLSEIQLKLASKIQQICLQYLDNDKVPLAKPQVGEESFYPRLTAKDSRLDINKTIFEQFNLFRVVDNYRYPAYFDYLGSRYILRIEKESFVGD